MNIGINTISVAYITSFIYSAGFLYYFKPLDAHNALRLEILLIRIEFSKAEKINEICFRSQTYRIYDYIIEDDFKFLIRFYHTIRGWQEKYERREVFPLQTMRC